jgi:hypothetical protein
MTIAPIKKPLTPTSLSSLDEAPAEDPFSMPGGADPDDQWFPPALENVVSTVRTHEIVVQKEQCWVQIPLT